MSSEGRAGERVPPAEIGVQGAGNRHGACRSGLGGADLAVCQGFVHRDRAVADVIPPKRQRLAGPQAGLAHEADQAGVPERPLIDGSARPGAHHPQPALHDQRREWSRPAGGARRLRAPCAGQRVQPFGAHVGGQLLQEHGVRHQLAWAVGVEAGPLDVLVPCLLVDALGMGSQGGAASEAEPFVVGGGEALLAPSRKGFAFELAGLSSASRAFASLLEGTVVERMRPFASPPANPPASAIRGLVALDAQRSLTAAEG
jgi:hypothetical protein